MMTVGFSLLFRIATFNAIHNLPNMILPRTSKIFEAQLVFDRDQQFTIRFETRFDVVKHADSTITTLAEQIGVFKYANQGNHIKFFFTFKVVETFTDNGYIGKVQRSGSCYCSTS